jgi:TonB family protein
MNFQLLCVIRTAVYLTVFYIVYSLLLSRDTNYSRNRAYILLAVSASFFLPLITFRPSAGIAGDFFGKLLPEVYITSSGSGLSSFMTSIPKSLWGHISIIYLAGLGLFLSKFILDIVNLFVLIQNNKESGSRIIKFHTFPTAGFSAMGYIFINSSIDSNDAEEIIKHERNHLNKNHFLDIIFLELAKSLQWFNPFIYFFDRSLRAVHEFQVDNECIRAGASIPSYQQLLLRQIFKAGHMNLSNSFSNPSLTRKRMIMMSKRKSSAITNLKFLAIFPLMFVAFIFISAGRNETSSQGSSTPELNQGKSIISPGDTVENPFVVVEEMPEYPGGDDALLKYIAASTVYPESASKNNIQGKVIVRFCVTAKGGVDRISVLTNTDKLLNEEAIRVVRSLHSFIPGRQGGKPVAVWYMVPVTFTLK